MFGGHKVKALGVCVRVCLHHIARRNYLFFICSILRLCTSFLNMSLNLLKLLTYHFQYYAVSPSVCSNILCFCPRLFAALTSRCAQPPFHGSATHPGCFYVFARVTADAGCTLLCRCYFWRPLRIKFPSERNLGASTSFYILPEWKWLSESAPVAALLCYSAFPMSCQNYFHFLTCNIIVHHFFLKNDIFGAESIITILHSIPVLTFMLCCTSAITLWKYERTSCTCSLKSPLVVPVLCYTLSVTFCPFSYGGAGWRWGEGILQRTSCWERHCSGTHYNSV